MAKSVKLADIASKLNISTVTVSKALSGHKGVSEDLRDKIIELADSMGYKQPSVLRKERVKRSYNLGVIIGQEYLDKYDSFYWQMYQKLTTEAVARGCFTMLEVISEEEVAKLQLPKLIQEEKIEGLIVIGRMNQQYLEKLEQQSPVPRVYLDFNMEKETCDAVISDSFYGACLLTNYLFDMGHKKIAYVGTILATDSITDRYFGYCKSMIEHGCIVREDWIIADRDTEHGKIDPTNLLQLPAEMPTAFVCNCDLTASELIRKLKKNGYQVPQDISVVGYDNYLFPGLCDVEITTYEVDMKEMGKKAISILLHKMAGDEYKRGISIVEGNLVYKESVKKLSPVELSEP
ncbi:MAG: substrate-binding domain-containing protein [Lachnospiraceae bacterium]